MDITHPMYQFFSLGLESMNNPWVCMSNESNAERPTQVDVQVVVNIPDIRPARFLPKDRPTNVEVGDIAGFYTP